MATTLNIGGTYTSTPDTPSPVYPDRLIRPLPKHPIRSRLSQEVADSILYPPAPPATQLFYGAYTENGEVVNDAKVYVQQNMNNYGYEEATGHHCDDEGEDSVEEDGPVVVRRSARYRRPSLTRSVSGRARQSYVNNIDANKSKSGTSGPDGYDAFENTNNKKKRKIPTSGNMGNHNSSLSTDLANMGISGSASSTSGALDDGNGTGQYHGTGTPASPVGNGISGPGRGRYGRSAGGRPAADRRDTPHSTQDQNGESDNNNNTSNTSNNNTNNSKTDKGIISAAIANAAALSSTTPRGQENVSLLEQQAKKVSPTKTQFTFTCESDSSKGMAWQTQNPYPVPHHRPNNVPPPPAGSAHRGFSTQGTQTSPNMASQTNQQSQALPSQHQTQGGQPSTQGKKSRRPPGNIYALAARQRKIQQQYSNLHHPPNAEDIWICEFCEYESIFGHPPEALIRQYEIKDRKERRRLAEKRRLLEKAKMKGRKGKKATKNAAKNAAAQQHPPQQGYDRQQIDHGPMDEHGDHDDDYLGDEYDDEPAHAPAPSQQPAHKHPPPPNNNHHIKPDMETAAKGMVGPGVGQAA